MKCKHISFATDDMGGSLRILKESSEKFGVDFKGYTPKMISQEFITENNKLLNNFRGRGAGYWIWKPWIILEEFKNSNDGDIIMYSDACMSMILDPTPWFDVAKREDIMLLSMDCFKLEEYTKRDCFIMMDSDTDEIHNTGCIDAAMQLYKVTETNKLFLEEYLSWCLQSNCVDDSPSELGPELPNYLGDHRHDQAILGLLAIKHNITRHTHGEFGFIFDHDRRRVSLYKNSG